MSARDPLPLPDVVGGARQLATRRLRLDPADGKPQCLPCTAPRAAGRRNQWGHIGRWLLGAIAGMALAAFGAWAADGLQSIPALSARVTDTSGTLDNDQRQALESSLAALEQRKGAQIAVLMVPTTQPEDIAQYSIRVVDAWKLGRKNVDDGALLIVAKNDHRVRIEVGRGLEGAIPDAASARIIREYITPKFRAGDFYGGIVDATDAMAKLVDGEPLPPPLADDRRPARGGGNPFNTFTTVLFVAIWLRAMFGRLRAIPRAGIVGVASGIAALVFGGVLAIAIGCGIFGAIIGLLGGGGGGFVKRGGWGGFGGGLGGGWSGGGGSWSGGGGGGFSGGGGGFSGGGASGSW